MLSGITSYLFGSSTEEVEGQKKSTQEPCFKTRPTENNEWILVDQASRDASLERSSCAPRVPHPHPTDSRLRASPSSLTSHGNNSDSGSDVTTLPDHVGPEESWLVTPPPCFTAGGHSPHHMEDNPLENLLIEHPSMSVYGPRGRQSSTGMDSEHSESSNDCEMAAEEPKAGSSSSPRHVVQHQPPRRPRALAARAGLLAHVQTIKTAQVAQQRHNRRTISRSKLQHQNKVREVESRNMRPRRKDHAHKPSGRSNNRRC